LRVYVLLTFYQMPVAEGGAEFTKWLDLNASVAIKLQLSSDGIHQLARRRSSSFISLLRGGRHRKLS